MSALPDPLWLVGTPLRDPEVARSADRRVVTAAPERSGTVTLVDTHDGAVAAAGCVLMAEEGGLTLLVGGAAAPLWQAGAAPGFLDDMADGPVRAALAGIVAPLRRLIAIGTLRRTEETVALCDALDKTRVRGTALVLEADDGRAVTVLHARALRGYDRDHARLVRALAERARLDPRAAAATLCPDTAGRGARPTIAIPPGTTAHRAATGIIGAYLDLARRSEAGIIADIDTEVLHDYRVALRKARSVVSLFGGVYPADRTEALKRRLAEVMARTGRLRDLDVALLAREDDLAQVPEGVRPGLARLYDALAVDRAAEHAALVRHLRSDAHAGVMRALAAMVDRDGAALGRGPQADRPARDLAARLIGKRHRKVRAIAATIDDATPDARVHELRVQCKKLRYLMELFAPAFERARIRPLIRALKTLQDVLGTFNDCAVQQAALAERLRALHDGDAPHRVEIATGVGALMAVLEARQRAARDRVRQRLVAFDAPATRAGFQELFDTARGRA